MEYHFSEKIEELLQSQRRTKKSLYEAIGMSMQGFDSMMKNNSFTAARLGAIADFFEMPVSEFYEKKEGSLKNERPGDSADLYLHEHLKLLEGNFARLAAQLESKDQQIADLQESRRSLQDMLKMVLGKSEGVTIPQLSDEEIAFETMFRQYRQLALGNQPYVILPKQQFSAARR